jgi:hypothetical protein
MRTWYEYVIHQYGSLDEYDDPLMIEDVRRKCEAWFLLHNRVSSDIEENDIEAKITWDKWVGDDKKFVTHLYSSCNEWLDKRGIRELLN